MVRIKEPRLGLLVAHTGRVRYAAGRVRYGPAEQALCFLWFNAILELYIRHSFFCIYVLQTLWQWCVKVIVKPWIKESMSNYNSRISYGHVSKILWKSLDTEQQPWVDDMSRDPSIGMIPHLKSTRRQDRKCIPDSSRPAGGLPELPLVQHLSM